VRESPLAPSAAHLDTYQRSSALIRGFLLLLLAVLSGCAGSAEVRFVSLQPQEIDPPTTQVYSFPAQECYWWTDDAGDLTLAWRCVRHNVFMGKYGTVDFQMSLVLDKPPAGSGRNYKVGGRETRSLFVSAFEGLRLVSGSGIVGVNVRGDDTLTGSFRIWMTPRAEIHVFSFLPQDPGGLLCFGKFRAVKDEKRGQAIRAYCEANGWSRPPRTPTTAPASAPAPAPATSAPTSLPTP
jgi:hypothetical protein